MTPPLGLTLFMLGLLVFVNLINVGAQSVNTDLLNKDMIGFAVDCLKAWQLDSIIYVGDSDIELHDMGKKGAPFQHFETFSELAEQAHDGEMKLLAFSTVPVNANDIQSLSHLLLKRLTILAPHPVSQQLLNDLKLRLDSMLFLYELTSSGTMVLHESYAVKGGRPKSQVIGNWAPQFGLRLSQWNMFERRKNLTGLTVINTVLPWPPVTIIEEDAVGSISQSGLFGEQFAVMKKALGFSTKFIYPKEKTWGVDKGNLTWTGMVGMLQRGEADVCTAALDTTLNRKKSIDFTAGVLHLDRGFFIPRKEKVSINMLIFMNVFVKNLWFGIAGAVAMISVCFLAIARLSRSISKLHSAQDSEPFGPLNSIALVILVYMQRDYIIYKYGLSTRIVYFTTCCSAFLIFAFYSAVLTAWMTETEPPSNIRSYEDVLQHGKTLYFWKDSLKEEELRDGTEGPAARELYYSSSRGISSNEEAFEALKTDKDAAVICMQTCFFGKEEVAKFAKVQAHDERATGWGLQKNSEFLGMFNHHLAKMQAKGILDRIELKWLSPPKPQPPEDVKEVAEALGGAQVFLPFAILLFGIAVSSSFILLEKVAPYVAKSLRIAPNRA